MINKVTVTVSFPIGAQFNDNIDRLVYTSFINFIKNISCVCIDTKCYECKEKEICRYSKITADNFKNYPGVSMKIPTFPKRTFMKNETKDFIFYFIGNQNIYKGYISVFFENLHQKLFNNFFYLRNVEYEELEEKKVVSHLIKVKTPIEKENFNEVYNKMIEYFNQNYDTHFSLLDCTIKGNNLKKVAFDECRFKTKRIKAKGYIGTYKSEQEIEIDSRLKEIGIGQYFFLGGGQLEIEDNS